MGTPFGSVVAFSSPDRARFFGPEFANVILPLYSGSAFVLSPEEEYQFLKHGFEHNINKEILLEFFPNLNKF